MSSITLTISGDSSQLSAQFCPAIDLSDDGGGEYVCGLVDFQAFNSIPNIDTFNNLFYFGNENRDSNEVDPPSVVQSLRKRRKRAIIISDYDPWTYHVIKIPTGSYELDHLAKYLQERVEKKGGKLTLNANNNTLQCELFCNRPVDFSKPNTVGPLLGFRNDKVLEPNETHESHLPANILKVNVIRIECNITTGSYLNNQPSHTIHEFSPKVPPGYKIIEVPHNVIYYPITVKNIQRLDLSIIDQNNQLINFRGETITIRLHIKRIHR